MRTTTRTKNKIKKFEGLRLKAYVCAAGVCTIGYGHTTGVKPGDVITEARADAFFESDIRAVENQVNALPLNLGQYQFDAVVSFCFNVGIGKFKKSTLYKKIRADLREGLPFWPIGPASYQDGWACVAIRNGKKTYLAVWRRGSQESTITLPHKYLRGKKAEAVCAYPADGRGCRYSWNNVLGELTVELAEKISARIFEITEL